MPALNGWRRQVFGDAALKLRAGETALAAAGNRLTTVPVKTG